MSRRLIENKLITLQPGDYLRAGGDGTALLKLNEETQGLIIKTVTDGHRKDNFLTVVLVNGHLINVWSEACQE